MAATLKLKVAPGAAGDEIVGWLGDTLKLRVSAPPEKGKANRAVVALLARTLSTSRDRIVIVAGTGSRRKRVRIEGLTEEELRKRIGAALDK